MRGSFDFETWEWVNPLCCGFAWGEKTFFIHDRSQKFPKSVAKQALKFMHSRPEVKQWWAHNGGKFDALFLLEAALDMGWQVTGHVAGGRLINSQFSPPGSDRATIVHDSYAVVQSSLKRAAKDFNLKNEKVFTEDDYSIDTRRWDPIRLREGCLADCEATLELLDTVEKLLQEWGGSLKITFSSSALSCVKSKLDGKIPSHKGKEELQDVARKGYYGARVEILHHMPSKNLTEFDICSSYPWAMHQRLPWVPNQGCQHKPSALLEVPSHEEGVVYAKVKVPETYLPALPWRDPQTNGIYFPTGTWEAWFPACELRYAKSLGVGVWAKDCICYSGAEPFGRFVDEVYRLKSEATGALRSFAKLVLNGCYGKFGQAPEREELRVFADDAAAIAFINDQPSGTVGQPYANRRVLTVSKFKWPPHTHYALAGYVTAYARMRLHQALLLADIPVYCDSDSVHCVESGRLAQSGMLGEKLGQFKVEFTNYKGTFYAPKIYRLKGMDGKVHLAAKGFPVEEDVFRRIVEGESVSVDRMVLTKSQLRKGGTVQRLPQPRSWAGYSSKRFSNPDGSTRPWNVKELIAKKHLKQRSPAHGKM